MAGVPKSELLTLNDFSGGVDNMHPEIAVLPRHLRAGVNVDIDDAGKLRRRKGYAFAVGAPGLHSLYKPHNNDVMYAGAVAGLVQFDSSLQQSVLTVLARPLDPMYFDASELSTYYSNGYDIGMIRAEGVAVPISAPQPAGQPNATVNAVIGGLNAGVYQVAITFVDEYGRESGSTLAIEIDVPEGGGIVLDDWPDDTGAAEIRVYLSPENGDVLYLAATLGPGGGSYLLGRSTLGRMLETQFLTPFPAATSLCVHNGRLHGAVGSTHVWSESLNFGLRRAATNWAGYNDKVSMIASGGAAAGAVLYIAAGNRTYALAGGDPSEWQRRIAHPAGAVPGSLTYVDASDLDLETAGRVPVWQDTKGELIAGLPDGGILRLHKDKYVSTVNAEHGSTAFIERDGIRQVIATSQGGAPNGIRATETLDAVICRNGVVVG